MALAQQLFSNLVDLLTLEESFWLPKGWTWSKIQELSNSAPSSFVPSSSDLIVAMGFGFLISIARWIITISILNPFANWALPKNKKLARELNRFPLNLNQVSKEASEILEDFYGEKYRNSFSSKDLDYLSKKIDLSQESISQWLHLRAARDSKAVKGHQKMVKKVTESLFKLIFYSSIWFFTVYSSADEPWLTDVSLLWTQHPRHLLNLSQRLVYLMELGLYFHFLVFQFYDTYRKDFLEMFAHHVATILLISISYISVLWRIGILVLIAHDFSDIFLELSKICLYMEIPILPDLIFVIFAVSFFICRLIVFPFYIIHSTFDNNDAERTPIYRLLQGLLMVLVCLHSYWMFLITRMIYRFLAVGGVEKDIRSESEVDEK